MNNQYLANIGAFEATFNKWLVKDATPKGKSAIYAEFKTKDGRIVSQRFNRPIGSFDHGKVATLMAALGKAGILKEQVAKANEMQISNIMNQLVGKECVVLVSVMDFNGKKFFQVKEVLAASASQYIEQGASNDPDNANPFGDDSVDPFAETAALAAFSGSSVAPPHTDEDLPF